jgi:hypothetical protein
MQNGAAETRNGARAGLKLVTEKVPHRRSRMEALRFAEVPPSASNHFDCWDYKDLNGTAGVENRWSKRRSIR